MSKPEEKIDFSCKVCGKDCLVAPDPPERAICPECCEDHEYEYEPGERSHFCKHCGVQAPDSFYERDTW